jgi:hypothetical protein
MLSSVSEAALWMQASWPDDDGGEKYEDVDEGGEEAAAVPPEAWQGWGGAPLQMAEEIPDV